MSAPEDHVRTDRRRATVAAAHSELDKLLQHVEDNDRDALAPAELAELLAQRALVDADTALPDALWEILGELRDALEALAILQRAAAADPLTEARRLLPLAESAAKATDDHAARARALMEIADRWKALADLGDRKRKIVHHFGSDDAPGEVQR